MVLVVGVLLAAWYFWPKTLPEQKIKVYFFQENQLTAFERPLGPNEAPLTKALKELLAGPNRDEKAKGAFSLLPPGTRLLGLKIQNKIASLNFSRQIENASGGAARLKGMVAQVVFTATDIRGIEKAWLWVEGQKEVVLGGEGLVLDQPLDRSAVSN